MLLEPSLSQLRQELLNELISRNEIIYSKFKETFPELSHNDLLGFSLMCLGHYAKGIFIEHDGHIKEMIVKYLDMELIEQGKISRIL